MKTLLLTLALMFGMPIASNLAAPTTMTAIVQEPTVPGPANPYCNKQPSDFSIPEVICPDDGYYQVDIACVNACAATYQAKMVEIYNSACSKYDSADQNYKLCFRLAIHAYDACYAAATTLYEREVCRNTLISATTDCITTLTSTRSAIAANVATDSAAAVAKFQECAKDCCVKVGKLGGNSNGGQIGGQGN